ncbi:branched-chain amino acid ABC transporter substrate-binding protein [Phreatobacter aquaticus]|uniref:Branched-chain amino acid ABC transporter substrate-binding protein n=1 Tax=Phreatobacter aquaticus TaxID=2570229 RepID=A0A4D7QM66_9HYPH|nr:ABC transporter substrate-binding protein [Phreatobacter aquaticus]QCK87083.1 branched-chain amino acid ABC transporter substrate-binding protein [Phreatobacter aquaticus]
MTSTPKLSRRHVVAGLAAAPAISLSGRAAFAADPIKIGFNGDLSASPSAQSGRAAVVGIQAAMEDAAKLNITPAPFTLVSRDDLSQPPKSIQNMSDLIDNEKVVAVFGPTNSGNALAWKHIPNQKRIPVMGCIGSATDITKPVSAGADNYMFRVGSVDRTQVVALMGYAKKNPNTKKIGFLTETTGYGQGGLKDLVEVAAAQGMQVHANEKFNVADTDMTSQLAKLKAAGVDTALVWAQGTPIGQLMRSMDKINYFPITLTSWAADNLSFINASGPALAEKPIFLRTVSETRTARQQALFDRIRPKLDADSAFSFAVHGYDATMLLALAIKQAGSTEGPKVRAALEDLQGTYEGYAKTYTKPFSKADHDALGAADQRWTCWRGGKLAAFTDPVIESLKADDFKG